MHNRESLCSFPFKRRLLYKVFQIDVKACYSRIINIKRAISRIKTIFFEENGNKGQFSLANEKREILFKGIV